MNIKQSTTGNGRLGVKIAELSTGKKKRLRLFSGYQFIQFVCYVEDQM